MSKEVRKLEKPILESIEIMVPDWGKEEYSATYKVTVLTTDHGYEIRIIDWYYDSGQPEGREEVIKTTDIIYLPASSRFKIEKFH